MYFTNDLRSDGFGAQYQSIIWSILWAECKGQSFLYSDIEHMVNPTNNEVAFLEQAKTCMNLRDRYPSVESVPFGVPVFALKWPYFYKEIEANMEAYHASESFQRIQTAFFANKKSPFSPSQYHIAVHIRRPLPFDNRKEGTDTPDTYYVRAIQGLLAWKQTQPKPIQIHLYSTGSPDDFAVYRDLPVQFHLEDDTFQTFCGMVFADCLVTSPSSFSYTAALLSKGEVLYYPFWHPPRKHWMLLS